ncbi:MAG: hypothetical protein WCF33_20820 [Pseudonocardiaceae bacterium]
MTSENDETSISLADEESVEVVIMRRDNEGGQATPLFSDRPVDLDSPDAPAPAALADLLDSTVRLVAPTDVPFGVVDLVRQVPVPEAFQALGWLREHRVLVFQDGRCHSGLLALRYDPDLGLSLDETD